MSFIGFRFVSRTFIGFVIGFYWFFLRFFKVLTEKTKKLKCFVFWSWPGPESIDFQLKSLLKNDYLGAPAGPAQILLLFI